MTRPINMLAIDLAKGSFQVCAIGREGAVLYNRMLSRTRLAALLRLAGLEPSAPVCRKALGQLGSLVCGRSCQPGHPRSLRHDFALGTNTG